MDGSLAGLILKYNTSGPRYTSYPPAPVFTSKFGPQDYREAILTAEQSPVSPDISLYLHIPFCDTLCYYCGCTTFITRNRQSIREYIQFLTKEIEMHSALLHPSRRVVQMHWGGGTPTLLSPAEIQLLGDVLLRSYTFDANAEISVEIDPRDLTYHHFKALRAIGFNRSSIGIQDFNPQVQRAVNRNQSEFITRQAFEWSHELGFSSINADLIYGLPLQTVESFSETLDKIIELSPDRIAAYNFAYIPWMKKHQRVIHPEDLPSPETKVQILITIIEKLSKAGYVYIGMDHFAKPNDELTIAQKNRTLHRNFQGYSTKSGADLYALGLSSISHFATTYAQNAKTLESYYEALRKDTFATTNGYRMNYDDQIRKYVIMRLMCDLQLSVADVEKKFDVTFTDYFSSQLKHLESLVNDGLLTVAPSEITITQAGRLFLRNIAMCFDAYLSEKSDRTPLYSKTV
jgi:oxygen-independent coproporphyrinogen-3 oxidase